MRYTPGSTRWDTRNNDPMKNAVEEKLRRVSKEVVRMFQEILDAGYMPP